MRHLPRRSARYSILALILAFLAAAGGAHAAAPEGAPALLVAIEPGGGPALERAAYEVEVVGAMAVGRLRHELANPADEDATARFVVRQTPGFAADHVELEIGGALRRLELEPVEADATSGAPRRGPARGSRDATAASPVTLRSEPFVVPAGEQATIHLRVGMPLPLERGRFTLTLPAVRQQVLPAAAGDEADGAGPARDRAARRTRTRSTTPAPQPVDTGVTVEVVRGQPLVAATSRTDDVLVDYEGDRTVVELVRPYSVAGRPFELSFGEGDGRRATLAGYVGPEVDGRREVSAVLEPPLEPPPASVRDKQVLFLLDTSGSMQGGKLDEARAALRTCLDKLGDDDRFNVLEFDTRFTAMRPAPADARERRRPDVRQWIDALQPGGGTQLLPALEAVLDQPFDEERHPVIIAITDGILADEDEVLALLKRKLGDRRLFVVGIGQNARQETLLRLAEYGRGGAAFARGHEDLEQVVVELFDGISRPLAWDVAIDWDGVEVQDVRPARLPDLYSGRLVRVLAWVPGADLPSELRMRVTTTEGERAYSVPLPAAGQLP